jgi:hypothetical protein
MLSSVLVIRHLSFVIGNYCSSENDGLRIRAISSQLSAISEKTKLAIHQAER